VRAAWAGVRVAHVEAVGVGDAPELGQVLGVRAVIDLGGLGPDDVLVQVAFGRVDEHDDLRDPTYLELVKADRIDGQWRYDGEVPLERKGSFGYTVRVLPRHELLASPAELGLVALPVESTAYTAI
jgi:starch phosphorylase